jgi:hypothetical protein
MISLNKIGTVFDVLQTTPSEIAYTVVLFVLGISVFNPDSISLLFGLIELSGLESTTLIPKKYATPVLLLSPVPLLITKFKVWAFS